jgi:hypothetical protein
MSPSATFDLAVRLRWGDGVPVGDVRGLDRLPATFPEEDRARILP